MADGGHGRLRSESFQLVQVNFSGYYNRPYEKRDKYIVTAPGFMLKFDSISEEETKMAICFIVQKDDVTGARVGRSCSFDPMSSSCRENVQYRDREE